MRLVSLKASGFRAFSKPLTLDLDANAIVLVGANGTGKTSFCDAVLWCLSDRVPRVSEADGDVISMYSDTDEAYVSLKLRDITGRMDSRLHSRQG